MVSCARPEEFCWNFSEVRYISKQNNPILPRLVVFYDKNPNDKLKISKKKKLRNSFLIDEKKEDVHSQFFLSRQHFFKILLGMSRGMTRAFNIITTIQVWIWF